MSANTLSLMTLGPNRRKYCPCSETINLGSLGCRDEIKGGQYRPRKADHTPLESR